MTDRYFAIPPDYLDNYKAGIVPDSDVLPLDIVPNARQLVTLSDGRVLVHMRLGQRHIDALRELADTAEPFTQSGITALDLAGSYIGETREDVLAAFPELAGTRSVEYTDPDTGETVTREVPLLPRHEWR